MSATLEHSRKRRAYWIADEITRTMRDRALLLAERGFDVEFFTTLETLLSALDTKRAGVLVVSDDGDAGKAERILTTLICMPEIQGARLIMVRTRHSSWLNFLAATGNVRDIIPSHLDDKAWLARFIFATAARALGFVQPTGQVSLNNISSISVPARLTWISGTRLRIESRVRPPVGATLSMGGPLADALGVNSVPLTVVSVERQRLLYRFSDAIVADWKVSAKDAARAETVLQELRGNNTGPRCRVYIAAQTLALRASLLNHFDDPKFEVNTALQKHSIVDEPRFFTPDLVIIEDKLVNGDDLERFKQMLDNLTPEATIIVLGNVPALANIVKAYPRRRIAQFPEMPKNLPQSALSRYARSSPEGLDADAAHVLSEHPFSLAEVNVPARLHRVHPLAAQIATPFPITNFALCRLDSPLVRRFLGRNPYVKVTATYQDLSPDAKTFMHVSDCYLADVDQDERALIAHGLTRLLTDSLLRLDPAATASAAEAHGETRTPELGSVRRDTAQIIPLPPPPKMAPHTVPLITTTTVAASSNLNNNHNAAAAAMAAGAATAMKIEPEVRPITVDEQRLIPTRELAELLRPALADVASELSREALYLRDDVVKGVKKTVKKDIVIQLVTAALVSGTALLLIWFVFHLLIPDWHKSGTVYSDQLKKFAPHMNRPSGP